MRDFKGMKRQRGRNRKPGGGGGSANSANPNRSWDSQGPENVKVRGNAQTVYERYLQLGRDASSGGDRVLAENCLQHAEHYFRVLRALQPQRPVSEIAARELSNQGYDIDFEDESGAQAAAFLAAQQAADRQAGQGQGGQSAYGGGESQERAETGQREWRDRDDRPREDRVREDRPRDERPREAREDRPRDDRPREDKPREDRAQADRPQTDRSEPRADAEARDGGRRESRRERWERRREERNRRFDSDNGEARLGENEPDAEAMAEAQFSEGVPFTGDAPVAEPQAPAAPRARRRSPRPEEASAEPTGDAAALPGFLTRATERPAPATTPAASEADETPAPRRRAPARRTKTVADES